MCLVGGAQGMTRDACAGPPFPPPPFTTVATSPTLARSLAPHCVEQWGLGWGGGGRSCVCERERLCENPPPRALRQPSALHTTPPPQPPPLAFIPALAPCLAAWRWRLHCSRVVYKVVATTCVVLSLVILYCEVILPLNDSNKAGGRNLSLLGLLVESVGDSSSSFTRQVACACVQCIARVCVCVCGCVSFA